MRRTENLRPVSVPDGRASAPIFVGAALLAMGIAYVLLLAQPGLVHSVSALWGRMPSSGSAPEWTLPAVAAGIVIGGAAIGVGLLSAFVRGVQTSPYVWLAPVLVGFSMLVMTGITVELPWPSLSQNVFSVLAGLVLIGGGAVLQMRGWACKTSGLLLLVLPLLSLLAGYAAMPGGMPIALGQIGSSAQLFLFVLGLTSLGIAFMALVTRRAGQSVELLAHRFHGQQQQLHEVVERMRVAEAHAIEAQRRAQLAEHRLRTREANPWATSAPDDAAAFAAMAKPGIPRSIWLVSALLVFSAVLAGLYAGLYRPLARRAAVQQAFVADAAREHASEIDSLRKHFQSQQANLQALLAAEQAKGKPMARPPAVQAVEKAARVEVPAKPVAAPAKPEAAPAKPEAASAKSEARTRRSSTHKSAVTRSSSRHAAPPKPAAKPVETKPAAAAPTSADPKLDRETRRALREHMNDDPIGGLEGM